MDFQVIWSDRGSRAIEEIVTGIALVNPTAAERFYNEVRKRVRRLGRFPRSGAVFERKRAFEVRQITYKKYRIFYQVRPRLQRVEIITIRHGARQEPRFRRH